MKITDFVYIGKVTRTYRYKGEVWILFEDDFEKNIKKSNFLFLEITKKPVPFLIKDIHFESSYNARVKFEDVDSELEAKKILHNKVFLPKKQLLKSSSKISNHVNFIDYVVIDHKIGNIGMIKDVYIMSMHEVAMINYQNKELLLPLNKETIIEIDNKEKIIYYRIPEGLLNI